MPLYLYQSCFDRLLINHRSCYHQVKKPLFYGKRQHSTSSKWTYYTFQFKYFLVYKKNIRFDFDDDLKIGDVRYKHST